MFSIISIIKGSLDSIHHETASLGLSNLLEPHFISTSPWYQLRLTNWLSLVVYYLKVFWDNCHPRQPIEPVSPFLRSRWLYILELSYCFPSTVIPCTSFKNIFFVFNLLPTLVFPIKLLKLLTLMFSIFKWSVIYKLLGVDALTVNKLFYYII